MSDAKRSLDPSTLAGFEICMVSDEEEMSSGQGQARRCHRPCMNGMGPGGARDSAIAKSLVVIGYWGDSRSRFYNGPALQG